MAAPAAPSSLAINSVTATGAAASWVDNASYSAGVNEILHLLFSPTPVGGTWTLSFDLETSSSIAYNADAAAVQSALEAMPSIGIGNVSVTAITGGFAIEFIGAAANLNIDVADVTVDDSLLYQAADTVTITEVQSGIADVPSTPSISTTTAAVEPVASTPSIDTTTAAVEPVTGVPEIEVLSLGGATTGTFNLSSADSGTSYELDAATISAGAIESAVETMGGAGVSVADNMDGTYTITWDGDPGAMPLPLQVTANSTDGSPSVSQSSAYVEEVVGVHQVDTITFDATPVGGSMTIEGNSLAHDANASTLSISGATASGTPASGTIAVTWDDYASHTPVTVSASSLLSVIGVHQIDTITFSATPVAGSMTIASSSLPYNEPGSGLGSLGAGAVVDGTPASGPLTVTWDDYTSHTPLDVDAGTMKAVVGREQRLTISLEDSPNSGEWFLTSYGSQFGANLSYDADVAAILAVLNGQGSAIYDWYGNEFFTTTNDPGIPSLGADGATLAKPGVTASLTTDQDGSPQSWDELGFWIQTSLDGVTWDDHIELGVNVTSWSMAGLSPATTYFVRVYAYNADGDSDPSNVVEIETLAASTSAAASGYVLNIGIGL